MSLELISFPFPLSHHNQSHHQLSHGLLHLFYNVTPRPLSFLFSPAPLSSQNDLWTHIFDHVTFHLKPFCCSYVHWLPDSQLLQATLPLFLYASVGPTLRSQFTCQFWREIFPSSFYCPLTKLTPVICSYDTFLLLSNFAAIIICLSFYYDDKGCVCVISYPWPVTLCLACNLHSVNISNERMNRMNFLHADPKKGKDTFANPNSVSIHTINTNGIVQMFMVLPFFYANIHIFSYFHL